MRRILFLLFLSLILGGRSKAQQDPVLDLQQTMPSEDSWWQFFGDSTLIRLIDKSVANNYNLQNAVKNIQLAKSRWRSQQGHFFPSFSASAQYTPEKSSLGIDHADNYYHIGQAGIEMNWEIDVFGNIRKGAKAQKEYYLASQEDYRGTMVSLASEVAMAYIRLRTYQQQLEVARNNLESQEEILRINEAKLAAGLTSNLTVAQSKGLWLQTKATLPGLEASVYSEVNTLAVLTGEYSDSLRQALLQVHPLPQGNPILMQGIPGRTDPAAPGCPLGRTDDGCTGSRSRRNTGRLVAEILPNGRFRVWQRILQTVFQEGEHDVANQPEHQMDDFQRAPDRPG